MNRIAGHNRIYILVICLVVITTRHAVSQSVDRVEAIGITVRNMDDALRFYTGVLPFEKVSDEYADGEVYEKLKGLFGIHLRKVKLRLGDEYIVLTDYLTTGGRPVPQDSRSNDLWFQHIAIVVSDMDAAYHKLRTHNVAHVSTRPQTLPKTIPAAAGIKAFYFQDPDGHTLELIYFPYGKGNPKWQQHDNNLFLGIDHTAIAVSRTAASSKFYNDLLGMKFQGESYNFGNEQEHLNNVSGARLRISGNKTRNGPGVEFLDYLAPADGRPYPVNARPDDLIHLETIVITPDATGLFEKMKEAGNTIISDGVIVLPSNNDNYRRGFYVRDPDGHVVGIFEK